MKFNVCIVDPPGYRFTHFMYDVSRLISFALDDLGDSCTMTRNQLEAGRLNLLVGAHNVSSVEFADQLIECGHPYIALQSEIIRSGRINDVDADAHFQQIYRPILEHAVTVWDGFESNVANLAEMDIEAHILSYGYHPRMREIRHHTDRDFDFCFFGSVTPRRRDILAKLAELGYRVRAYFDEDALFRNDLIARSEVVLTLRQSDTMTHLPHARILYLVNNACLAVGEGGYGQEPLEDLFVWTNDNDVIELCRETRARDDRRELAESFHERFKQRSMRDCVAPLLEKLPHQRINL